MAVTKIKSIHTTVGKSIDYIKNKHKTDNELYVDSYKCAPETAAYDFAFTAEQGSKTGNVLAFHLIQSFVPGEVTGEEAHTIGKDLANMVTEGKYQYVIATHVDKQHIHNHIIFNAVSDTDYKKYRSNYQFYHRIRDLSDSLCEEHGLHVIKEPEGHGVNYKKWMEQKGQTNFKEQLKATLDVSRCNKYLFSHCENLLYFWTQCPRFIF